MSKRFASRSMTAGLVAWLLCWSAAVLGAGGDADRTPSARLADSAKVDRLVAERAASANLTMRILNTEFPAFERKGTEWVPSEPIRVDLFEQARGSTDPVALDLLLARCLPAMAKALGCDPVALARRWVDVDRQNQVAWLGLADALDNAGLAAEATAALQRGSLAPAWHEHSVDVGRLLLAASRPEGSLDDEALVLSVDLGNVNGSVLPARGMQSLMRFCKDVDHRPACRRIVETMARDTDAAVNLKMVVLFAARAGLDASAVDDHQIHADAVFAVMQASPLPEDFRALDDVAKRKLLLEWRDLLDRGEVRYWRGRLSAYHLDERSAAARYVSTLSAAERERRAERRSPR